MDPARWQLAEALFFQALSVPRAERTAWLLAQVHDDELLRQVRSMLEADSAAAERLQQVVVSARQQFDDTEDSGAVLPGQRLGNYLLVREIGRGGMGTVYQAIRADGEFHQAVAVKVMHTAAESPENLNRFRQERHILARLDHPHIARMFDGGTTPEGWPYFVMELVDGIPVTAYCAKRQLSSSEMLTLFLQICDGVAHAHERQVVHRDLKPGNILVTPDGKVRLLDFGIAKWLDPDLAPETIIRTATGFTPLTPDYASPEQHQGNPVSERGDIYSLGAILFEMRTGQRAVAVGPTTRTKLAGNLAPVVERAMALQPENRYASVGELAAAVRATIESERVPPTPLDAEPVSPGRPAWRFPLALASLVLLALTVFLWLQWPRGNEVKSIAVLPFVDLTSRTEDTPLADGLTEDIITQLALIPGLDVPSRTAVWQYRGRAFDPREMGRSLGVSAVLEGSVRRAGNQVRVVAQLISVRDGFHLWAQSYDYEDTDLLALQSTVARLVGQELRLRLVDGSKWNRQGRAAPDGAAQQAYLEGYRLFQMDAIRAEWAANPNPEGLPPRMEATIRAFERATELDPEFAGAWASLAEVMEWAATLHDGLREELCQRSRLAARKALELEPTNALAMATLGILSMNHDWDLRAAEPSLRLAVELSPRTTGLYADYADCLIAMGRLEEAVTLLGRAQLLEPGSARPSGRLAVLMAFRGDETSARLHATHALALEPRNRHALWALAFLEEQSGNSLKSEVGYRDILRLHPTEDRTLASLGSLLARNGQRAEAILIAGKLRNMSSQGRRREVFEALVRCSLGDRRTALSLLEQAWQLKDANLLNLELDPRFASLAGEPRFEAILAQLRTRR
ncbi:MAG: protein kinase [Bryobacterales bacterium]|nr:protein kinase [Bryobacterales bacterium]